MTVVIGTAGHIDHGKSTLLRALTGIDPDRLPEERRRGMTIDVGYAHLALPDGGEVDFVDVPGHDRLVGNMLVGAGEIDAAMLVVAADDGPRAQTIEHLELLDAMGVTGGLAVVTKIDLVDAARRDAVARETAELLVPTALRSAPVLAVSATNGEGLDLVREALFVLRDRLVDAPPGRDAGPPRLAIDRAFSVRGRGTVVTGTLRGGRIAPGDTLRLEPGGGTVRVREVQVHGSTVESAGAGRTALALAGVALEEVGRGMVITADPNVEATDRLLVVLRPPAPIAGSPRGLPADRTAVRVHVGTEQVDGIVGRTPRDSAALGDGRATALLRLARPVAVAPGDRFVLRRPSLAETLAGGVVLDVRPPRGASRRRATPTRLEALARAPGEPSAILDLHGASVVDGTVRLAPDLADLLAASAVAAAEEQHAVAPDSAGLSIVELRQGLARELRRRTSIPEAPAMAAATAAIDELVSGGGLVQQAGYVRDPRHRPAGSSAELGAAMDRLAAALGTPTPPPLAEAARATGCPPDGIRALERDGRIVLVEDDLAWEAATWQGLADLALEMARRGPLAPAAYRDATGTSRKYVMAMLEDLDRRGILRRTPDGHVPGPRAPEPAATRSTRP